MSDVLQLLLVGGAFFLIMRFGCGSHLFGHRSKGARTGEKTGGGGCCGHSTHEKTETADQGQIETEHSKSEQPGQVQHGNMPPEKDTDPVCGMEVATKTAKSSAYNGLVYFFCSQDCRNTFEASPEKYIVPGSQPAPPRLEH